jgi:hypothetical protein
MAQVDISSILEYYEDDLARALERAVKHALPGADFNRGRLFTAFLRAIENDIGQWESVPDQYVVSE